MPLQYTPNPTPRPTGPARCVTFTSQMRILFDPQNPPQPGKNSLDIQGVRVYLCTGDFAVDISVISRCEPPRERNGDGLTEQYNSKSPWIDGVISSCSLARKMECDDRGRIA